jgi:glutamyl-tRNA synthetase
MLVLLGWNPGGGQEILSKDEMISLFSFERVNKSGAKFDPDKTKWFNQQYLRAKSNDQLAELFMPVLKERGIEGYNDAYLVIFCSLMKEKAQFISDFWIQGSYFFEEFENYDETVLSKKLNDQTKKVIADFNERLKVLNGEFSASNIEAEFKLAAEINGIAHNQVLQLARVAVSGASGGPLFFEMVSLFGKNKTIQRLERFLHR